MLCIQKVNPKCKKADGTGKMTMKAKVKTKRVTQMDAGYCTMIIVANAENQTIGLDTKKGTEGKGAAAKTAEAVSAEWLADGSPSGRRDAIMVWNQRNVTCVGNVVCFALDSGAAHQMVQDRHLFRDIGSSVSVKIAGGQLGEPHVMAGDTLECCNVVGGVRVGVGTFRYCHNLHHTLWNILALTCAGWEVLFGNNTHMISPRGRVIGMTQEDGMYHVWLHEIDSKESSFYTTVEIEQ